MSIFQRNAILAGYINSYCLVCESFFETEEQTFSHIAEDEHKKRLHAHPYIEKFGNNGIRKVKAGYFCEHCSLLVATAAKVNFHIADKLHYVNKGNSLLKQSGSILTAFDDILIPESAWHSFTEDTCVLCDVEFDDPSEHKVEQAHVMKLLQNKVEFGEDNNIYRRIDKNEKQCLTCNCVLKTSTDEHFKDDAHKQKYMQCQEEKKKYDLANSKETKVKQVKDEAKVEKTGKKVRDASNNVETVTGKAVTQETITKAQNTQNKIKTPTKKQIKNINAIKPESDEPTDPASYAKKYKLAYDPKNVNAFCITCEKKFSSTLHGMKEHVSGRDHNNKTAKATSKPAPKQTKLEKRLMKDFVITVSTFDNTLDNDTIINETICVPEKSCHFFTKIASRFAEYRCQICLMNLSEDDLLDHCRTAQHEKGMRLVPIIMETKNEFIREVRPETFHCGFCNIILPSWTATQEHLKTQEHKVSADSCRRRLQIHMPAIRAQNNDENVKAALFRMFLDHFNY